MAKTFRSILRFLVPSWLNDAVTQSHADIIDENLARVRAGLEARFPSTAQPDALYLIGRDRGIPRGRTETADHYRQRLIAWRYPRGHRVRGSAFALLNQVSEYFGGIFCWTIDRNGNRHDRASDGSESFSYGYPWDWDGVVVGPGVPRGRFWLVLNLQGVARPNPKIGDPNLWGGAIGGGRGYTVGHLGVTSDDVIAIRRLLYGDVPWRPAGTLGIYAVISLDGATPVPTAAWKDWTGRSPNYRYWRLTP